MYLFCISICEFETNLVYLKTFRLDQKYHYIGENNSLQLILANCSNFCKFVNDPQNKNDPQNS